MKEKRTKRNLEITARGKAVLDGNPDYMSVPDESDEMFVDADAAYYVTERGAKYLESLNQTE